MKKRIVCVLIIVLILVCSCANNSEEKFDNDIDKTIIHGLETFYKDETALIDRSTFIILGKVTDISFEVLNIRLLLNPENKPPRYFFHTVYTIDVIESYKGDCKEGFKIRKLGGLASYKEKEQLELIEANKNYLYDAETIEEIGNNWSIPIYSETVDIKEGTTYIFMLNEYGYLLNSRQALYELSNPFEDHNTLTLHNVLSKLNVWDEFWAQWQKDNPNWETWLDKAEVEAALLK